MYRDNAIVNLADAPQILPLDAGGLVPFLEATGLVNDTDGPQRIGRRVRQDIGYLALEEGTGLLVIPVCGG